jgi:hypothetical protein
MDKTLTGDDEFGGEVEVGIVYPRWEIVEIRRVRRVSRRMVFTWRIRGSGRTSFMPWPEWRRDGAPGQRRTELGDNGGVSREWALKERRGEFGRPVEAGGSNALLAHKAKVGEAHAVGGGLVGVIVGRPGEEEIGPGPRRIVSFRKS